MASVIDTTNGITKKTDLECKRILHDATEAEILDMVNEEEMIVVKAEMPVSESFGIAEELRSSTQGRAFWATQFSRWAIVPEQMQAEIVKQIRERRGLSATPPKAEEFFEDA